MTALITENDEQISYAELAGRADAFASGLPVEVRLLAIAASNELATVVAYLGALRLGVPVILFAGVSARAGVLKGCPPDAIYEPDAVGAWRLATDVAPWRETPSPELALLLSTSGSTGSPRLVRLSRTNLQANAASIAQYLELGPDERAITSLPLSYSYGLSVLNSHLSAGASVVLTDASVSDPEFKRLLEHRQVTSIAGVPYSYELMDRCGLIRDLPPSVRTLTQAGGRMVPEMVTRVAEQAGGQGARLFVMYGQTEATARIAFLPPERLGDHVGAIGVPIPGGMLWVEDNGRRLLPGQEGELVYRGPNVMMGYAVSRSDLAAPAGGDILHTGDIAIEGEDGVFRITGRKSRFVKPYGLRVSLDEIEARLREAGPLAVVSGGDDLIVIAAPASDGQAIWETLRELSLPTEIFEHLVCAAAPRLPGGKPDYVDILLQGRAQRESTPENGRGLVGLESIFTRLARGRPVGSDVSFEALGGDSLSYVQCSIAIEQALGELPVAWEHLSLGEIRTMARTLKPSAVGRRATIEGNVLVRCLAILQVLAHHAFGGMQGGADILMILAGFSWARFQRRRLLDGRAGEAAGDFALRYLIIYAAIVAGVSILNHDVARSHFLLFSTFRGDWGGILNTYWFIESLTWCVGVVCIASLIPGVRRWTEAKPLLSALAFVGLAVVIRVGGSVLMDAKGHAFRSPDQMLIYFAAGWALVFARPALKLGLFALLAIASSLAWTFFDTHLASLAIAAALLVGFPRMSFPTPVARAITLVATASFYIYLFNPIPIYLTDQILHAHYGRFAWMQIVFSLTGGIGLYWVAEWIGRQAWTGGKGGKKAITPA